MKVKIKSVNIDICRVKAGIKSDTLLAKEANISRSALLNYKNGKFENISIKTLMHLCEVMNCKIDDIVQFEYEEVEANDS